MPLPNIKNRVGNAVSGTPGTGTITLGSAESGYQSFSAAYGANANVDILIEEGTSWEIARDCTYTHSGTTLTRGTLESSSTGSAVSFTSAAKVYVVSSAERINRQQNRGVVIVRNDGSATQSFTASTYTKVTSALVTEEYDQNGWWDNTTKTFQPDIAGFYSICAGLQLSSVGDQKNLMGIIRKNDSDFMFLGRVYTSVSSSFPQVSGAIQVYMNGTTDYAEFFIFHNDVSSRSSVADAARTFFCASFIGE